MAIPSTTPDQAAPIPGRPFRLPADRFERIRAAGIFAPGERVELRDGVIRSIEADVAIPRRLTLDDYHRMIAEGILGPDDRVELLEGWLVAKMSLNPPHKVATHLAFARLQQEIPPGWHVAMQAPVSMPVSDSEPEPDLQITRGNLLNYLINHPGPEDVGLLVEVAASSLVEDRGLMKRLYAAESVPIYWIVNLCDRRVEVFEDPTGPGIAPSFRRAMTYGPDDEVPVVLDGVEVARVAVRDLLP